MYRTLRKWGCPKVTPEVNHLEREMGLGVLLMDQGWDERGRGVGVAKVTAVPHGVCFSSTWIKCAKPLNHCSLADPGTALMSFRSSCAQPSLTKFRGQCTEIKMKGRVIHREGSAQKMKQLNTGPLKEMKLHQFTSAMDRIPCLWCLVWVPTPARDLAELLAFTSDECNCV